MLVQYGCIPTLCKYKRSANLSGCSLQGSPQEIDSHIQLGKGFYIEHLLLTHPLHE